MTEKTIQHEKIGQIVIVLLEIGTLIIKKVNRDFVCWLYNLRRQFPTLEHRPYYLIESLKVAIAMVAVNTGTMDLDLWENNMYIDRRRRKVHFVNSVQVRQWMGKKKLSTVFPSAFP